MAMKKTALAAALAGVMAMGGNPAWGMKTADPFLVMFTADKLEVWNDAANTRKWEVDMWAGTDWHKLWLYSEGESVDGVMESENMLVYSTPVDPYWDFQIGMAHDEKPGATYNWGAVGFNGLAPYYFETQAHLLFGEGGELGLRASFEYEVMLTQFLVLTPEVELTAYSEDIPEMELGSGLSSLSFGMRLRYEITREFAPYIGVQWMKRYGQTADYLRAEGEKTEDTVFVAGVRMWF